MIDYIRNLSRRKLIIIGLGIGGVILIIGLIVGLSSSHEDTILDRHILVDGHNDIASMVRKNFQNQLKKFDFNDMTKYKDQMVGTNGVTHTDILRLKEGKVGAQFWAVYASCESLAKDALRIHMEQLDLLKRLIKKFPNEFEFATTSKGLIQAYENRKVASLLGLESGHAIDSSMSILRIFYNLGIRYMTLTHNCDVPWATNHLVDRLANASDYGGLTNFGRKIIQEMNRLGMMVDLSHTSHQTMLDALDESKAPVIFSHSSVKALCNQSRNVRDDVLLKLKENNGIIMINFYNGFVNCDDKANVRNVADHINYVKKLIGVDHIGIGSDYDGVPATPDDLEDVSKFPNLFKELLDNGWEEEDLVKIAGANILRVFSDVEKYAESVRKTIEPIDEVIDQKELNDDFKKCRTSF